MKETLQNCVNALKVTGVQTGSLSAVPKANEPHDNRSHAKTERLNQFGASPGKPKCRFFNRVRGCKNGDIDARSCMFQDLHANGTPIAITQGVRLITVVQIFNRPRPQRDRQILKQLSEICLQNMFRSTPRIPQGTHDISNRIGTSMHIKVRPIQTFTTIANIPHNTHHFKLNQYF